MTLTAPHPATIAAPSASRPRRAAHMVAFGVLLVATAALYVAGLSASGWANAYYSAAVQAGSRDWTAFLFGSSDAANAITIDKTPAALWVMGASVRLFGLNPWSVLLPQALEGVAAVAVLYAAVRRTSGPHAGLLVLPAFGLTYLLTNDAPRRVRVRRTLAALAALVLTAGWYLALVELWPAAQRPYIGGSQQNSIFELALGYNGFGRLTGDETGGLGNPSFDAGWGRLLGPTMGTEIGWLLPASVICLAAALAITRRAPRTDPTRRACLLWAGWLAVTSVVFSFSVGIIHPYYTVALAPAVAGGFGTGGPLPWRRRSDPRAATAMAGIVLLTTVLACVLLARDAAWMPWLRAAVAVAGTGAAVLLLVAGRLGRAAARTTIALALAACLAAPTMYSIATAATPHRGIIPSAGRFGGFSGPFGAKEPSAAVLAALSADADRYTWPVAAVGSSTAAEYQLATGKPVMAVGGFNGTDPYPTLDEFRKLVDRKEIHYFIAGTTWGPLGGPASGSREAADIGDWVAAHFRSRVVDGVTLWDVTRATSTS